VTRSMEHHQDMNAAHSCSGVSPFPVAASESQTALNYSPFFLSTAKYLLVD